MNPQLIQVATDLASSLLTSRTNQTPTRWALLALGGVVALIGAIFLAIAADLALVEYYMSPPLAAATVGGVLLVVALILFLVGRRHHRIVQARTEEFPLAALTEFAGHLLGEFEGAIQASPKSSAAAAFAAGCVVGSSSGLQRGLRDLMR